MATFEEMRSTEQSPDGNSNVSLDSLRSHNVSHKQDMGDWLCVVLLQKQKNKKWNILAFA